MFGIFLNISSCIRMLKGFWNVMKYTEDINEIGVKIVIKKWNRDKFRDEKMKTRNEFRNLFL